jgi:hypothetical protein
MLFLGHQRECSLFARPVWETVLLHRKTHHLRAMTAAGIALEHSGYDQG